MEYYNKHNFWLVLAQLIWFAPICYYICVVPLDLMSVQGIIDVIPMAFVGLLCIIFYHNNIGKITASIYLVLYFVILLFVLYSDVLDDNVSISSVFFSMTPSFRIVVLVDLITMLLVPLSLIFQKRIMEYRRSYMYSIIFTILVLSVVVYSSIWTYVMQDKIVLEEYNECKENKKILIDKNNNDVLNRLYLEYSYVYGNKNDLNKAEEYLLKILNNSPTIALQSVVYSNLTKICIDKEDVENAKKYLNESLMYSNDHEGEVYNDYLLAKVCALEGKTNDALHLYESIFVSEDINSMTLSMMNDYLKLLNKLKKYNKSLLMFLHL